MSWPVWTLTPDERRVLERALDALLPPDGSFPKPSQTRVIDGFILKRVPPAGTTTRLPYPGIDSDGLRTTLTTLADLAPLGDMTTALEQLERDQPSRFAALWRLAVYGYYSQPETIAAIQRELAPPYHGAPLPLGYAHAIAPWDPADPLQLPVQPRGSYVPTDEVTRVTLDHSSERAGAKS